MYRIYLIAALLGLVIPLIYFSGFMMGKGIKKTRPNAKIEPIFSTPTKAPRKITKWGVFAGGEVKDFAELKNKLSTKGDYLPVFVHWGNENQFPSELGRLAKNEKQTLVIYWEAMDYNSKNPKQDNRYNYDAILEGKWDEYLRTFAQSAKAYKDPVIVVPFEEMNGEWYPWSVMVNNNSGDKHVKAYRHIRNIFIEATNVKFGWVINHESVPESENNDPLKYYPGDEYVDYIGINGFNFDNPWIDMGEIFNRPYDVMKKIQKPMIIFSMASAEGPKKSRMDIKCGRMDSTS